MGLIFWLLGYISSLITIILAALSMSSGLFLLAELAEEYPTMAGKITKNLLIFVLILHFVLYLDGLPLFESLTGMISHLIYSSMLNDFPFVEILSIQCMGSIICFVLCNVLWLKYFLGIFYDPLQIIGFFVICVWSIPLALFVSLTLSESSLPGGLTHLIYHSNQTPNNNNGLNTENNQLPLFSNIQKKSIFKIIYEILYNALSKVSVFGIEIFNAAKSLNDKRK